MRGALTLALALLLAGQPALAQEAAPTPDAASLAQDVAALRDRLLASQQRVAVLEQQLADEKSKSARITVLEAKNARLVEIGQQLIASYDQRFRRSQKDPLQLGRVRFERELQGMGNQMYDNRADVPVPAQEPAAQTQPSGNN